MLTAPHSFANSRILGFLFYLQFANKDTTHSGLTEAVQRLGDCSLLLLDYSEKLAWVQESERSGDYEKKR